MLHKKDSTIQRTPGNAVPVTAQKRLTGKILQSHCVELALMFVWGVAHPKGGAAAWVLGGCRSVLTGIVPGNRSAE